MLVVLADTAKEWLMLLSLNTAVGLFSVGRQSHTLISAQLQVLPTWTK